MSIPAGFCGTTHIDFTSQLKTNRLKSNIAVSGNSSSLNILVTPVYDDNIKPQVSVLAKIEGTSLTVIEKIPTPFDGHYDQYFITKDSYVMSGRQQHDYGKNGYKVSTIIYREGQKTAFE